MRRSIVRNRPLKLELCVKAKSFFLWKELHSGSLRPSFEKLAGGTVGSD